MTEFNYNKSSYNLSDLLSIDEKDHNDYANVNTNDTMLLILNIFSQKKSPPEEDNFYPTLYFTKIPTMSDTKHKYEEDKKFRKEEKQNIIESNIISDKKENNKIKNIFKCNIIPKDNLSPNNYDSFSPNSVNYQSKIFRVDAAKKHFKVAISKYGTKEINSLIKNSDLHNRYKKKNSFT